MGDFFEIVFEGIEGNFINDFAIFLINHSASIYEIGDLNGIDIKDIMLHYDFQGLDDEFYKMLVLRNFFIDESSIIPIAFLRFFKYEGKMDVEISFKSSNGEWVTQIMRSAKNFSKKLRQKFIMNDVYAGMEPASDEETRYFTNEVFGPLLMKI